MQAATPYHHTDIKKNFISQDQFEFFSENFVKTNSVSKCNGVVTEDVLFLVKISENTGMQSMPPIN
jgi:hypothetical protein